MARIRDYTQFEGYPFGYGEFELDDGSKVVLDDPERARKVVEERYGSPDSLGSKVASETNELLARPEDRYDNAVSRLALGPGAPQKELRPRLERPDPMRGAVAGPGGGIDDDRAGELAGAMDDAGGAPPPAAAASAQQQPSLSENELRQRAQAEEGARLLASIPAYRRVPGVDPEKMQREGKPVDQSFMRQGGLPEEMTARQKAERDAQYAGTNQVLTTVQNETLAARAAEAERMRAEAAALKEANDKRDLELQRKTVKYQTERAALEREVDDYYDKSKPDPDGGLRKARGPIGNIASAIAQFMGAYAAIISGSPNFANQILNKKIDTHVDAQIEEFRRGKMKRDGQLQRMAERGMSIEQMRAALKLQQELYIRKEAETRAYAEGTRESKAAFQTMMAGRAERQLGLEQEFEKEALGKETVSGAIVQPKPGGLVPLTPEERLGTAVKRKKLANEFGDELAGGETARKERWRQEDRQDKRSEQQGKVTEDQAKAEAAWNTLEAYGDAVGIKKDPRTGARIADQSLFSKDTLLAPGQREAVNDLTGQGKPIEAARRSAIEGIGRLQSGGVISPNEAENFTRLLGDEHATRAQIATNLNALRALIQSRRSPTNQQRSTAAPSSWKREDEE